MERSYTNLKKFIQDEINRRKISVRKFAEVVGVGHTTINRILDERAEKQQPPTLEFLVKLAVATQTDLAVLLSLAYPDMVNLEPSTEARLFADSYAQAPEHIKEAVRALLVSSNQHV